MKIVLEAAGHICKGLSDIHGLHLMLNYYFYLNHAYALNHVQLIDSTRKIKLSYAGFTHKSD